MSMCIYHGNCADGFGAAWAVRNAMKPHQSCGTTYMEDCECALLPPPRGDDPCKCGLKTVPAWAAGAAG